MSVLLIDPFSSGTYLPALLHDADVAYYAVRTRRALSSGLSDGAPLPNLLMDSTSHAQLPELTRFCKEHAVVDVIAGSESGVPLAEALKFDLRLASTRLRDRGRRYWDKSLLYSTVREAGLQVPHSFGAFSADDAGGHERRTALLRRLSFPAVVKPDVGAGSVGVRVVTTPLEAIEAIESIVSAPALFGGKPRRALVQEYVGGREYVVDTFSRDGRHLVIAVCTYDKHPSSAGVMVYDRLRWLEWQSKEAASLSTYATSVLDALQHRDGAVHMEVIMGPGDPCLVDLGARPHGAGHPMKTFALTGTSQLHAQVDAAAGRALPSSGYRLKSHAAIEFLSVNGTTAIREDAHPSKLLTLDYVLSGDIRAQPGMIYSETHSLLDAEALGVVFVTGTDADDVAKRGGELRRAFAEMLEPVTHA